MLIIKTFRNSKSVSKRWAHLFVFLCLFGPFPGYGLSWFFFFLFCKSGFWIGSVLRVAFFGPICNPHRGRPGVYIAVYSPRVMLRLAVLLRPVRFGRTCGYSAPFASSTKTTALGPTWTFVKAASPEELKWRLWGFGDGATNMSCSYCQLQRFLSLV